MRTRTSRSYSKKCLKSGVWFSKIQKKASSSMIVKSYQSHMSCIVENFIHMLLDISLSFVKFSDPIENLFMFSLSRSRTRPPPLAKFLHWELANPQNKWSFWWQILFGTSLKNKICARLWLPQEKKRREGMPRAWPKKKREKKG